jgi:hypothetical protein
MILFKDDWSKHPGSVIHYHTRNKSFLHVAEVFHRMGVANCAFHLSLLDPDLQDVDPFAGDLDIVTKAKIVAECKSNFWYYLREVERIPEPGSSEAVMFNANRMNIALYWLFFNHVMTIVVILRQTGKTTTLLVLVKYLMNFGTMNTFINLLTKSEGLKAETLLKGKALFEELPGYLNFSKKSDIFNTDMIHLKDLDNKFKGNLSSSSPKQAEKVGRGFTSGVNLIDETVFVENIATAVGAMLMSGNFARMAAEKNGNPYGTIFATTAGDTDDRDGAFAYSLVTGSTVWDELFYDIVDLQTLNDVIYKNCSAGKNQTKRPMVCISMSYLQLGYDDVWLKKTLEANISTPENISRDLFNKWLAGSSASPIPKNYLETMRANMVETPMSRLYAPYNYLLKWYIKEEEVEQRQKNGHHFIIGVDTSDGVGRDDISFVVRDHVCGDVICAAAFNELNLITLAGFFVSFLVRYPASTMVIERRSSAAAIIDFIVTKLLAQGINPFSRLYNAVYQNKDQMRSEFEELSRARAHELTVFDKYRKHIGFVTSASGITARSELYSVTLIHMLKFTGHLLRDKKLVDQIAALVIRNNRVDHPVGGNDDMVVGGLLSYWLLITGKNLQHYGIDTSMLLRQNDVYLQEKYKTDQESLDAEDIMALEEELKDHIAHYRQETNPILAKRLELKIRHIASSLQLDNNVISVQEMLETLHRDKRLTRTY